MVQYQLMSVSQWNYRVSHGKMTNANLDPSRMNSEDIFHSLTEAFLAVENIIRSEKSESMKFAIFP